EGEYELLITPQLILQPQVELNWFGQSDSSRGIGRGFSTAEAALRLRYEFRREIAPYVGLVRERKFGATADRARAAGEDADDTRLVAGVRLRF
ncbi:MAG: copper resistance protein B, partial [Lysobacterales bacterium]